MSMRKVINKENLLKPLRRKKAGAAPGTLIHIGEQKSEEVKISLIDYTRSDIEERELSSIEECFSYRDKESVTWINIDGLHDVDLIEKIGGHFKIHPLVLEDILNTRQRPKLDDHESYMFVVMKMLAVESGQNFVKREQVSIILGPRFVISFQEQEGDVFESVRERIRAGKGRLRKLGADYLAYALMDAIVDHYFIVMDEISEKIDILDSKVIKDPTPEVLQGIYFRKREIVSIRKSIAPLRDVLSRLHRSEPDLLTKEVEVFFGDVFDHLLQVIESLDANREIISGLIDLYLSSVSNRTNEVMKVLTIMAALFIPITFIAGVYGMNFEVIPELKWKYGYAYVWGLMFSMAAGMIIYFKKKKWM